MRPLALSVALALAAPGAALAAPAETARATWMHTGADARAPIVQSLPGSAEIDVVSCGRQWCFASWRGVSGYIQAKAVIFGSEGSPYGPPPVDAPAIRTWGFGFNFGNLW
jgi:hypothetical protein